MKRPGEAADVEALALAAAAALEGEGDAPAALDALADACFATWGPASASGRAARANAAAMRRADPAWVGANATAAGCARDQWASVNASYWRRWASAEDRTTVWPF